MSAFQRHAWLTVFLLQRLKFAPLASVEVFN